MSDIIKAIADPDDILLTTCIEHQIQLIDEHSEVDLSRANVLHFKNDSSKILNR